jgi:glycosyltransferase involved in cell wall biosynthesis
VFTDCYFDTNGVARTYQQLVAFARQRGYPLLCAHCGDEDGQFEDGPVRRVQMRRGAVAVSLEADLGYDPTLWRHTGRLAREFRSFRPDLIQISGPGDVGLLGAYFAHRYRIPLVASWHTNLEQYAERRLERQLSWLTRGLRQRVAGLAGKTSLALLHRFYRAGRLLLAPTEELVERLSRSLGRPARLMRRGVDTASFSPAKRHRHDSDLVLGFVGRLSPEKNLRTLQALEQYLVSSGVRRFRFLIVGGGRERAWLQANLRHAELPGVLKGEALARAYANMDLFVFPSKTDTFGNVVLEALASGVPAVVTSEGGPKHVIEAGVSGLVARSEADFRRCVLALMGDPARRGAMAKAARRQACRTRWDDVFHRLYEDYGVVWEERVPDRPPTPCPGGAATRAAPVAP